MFENIVYNYVVESFDKYEDNEEKKQEVVIKGWQRSCA